MKVLIKLAIAVFISFSINAQSINSNELVGTWKVINGATTSELPEDVGQMMQMMLDGFEMSIWTFYQNGTFKIKFKDNLSPLMEEMKFLDNKLWRIDAITKEIRIGTKSDGYNHLVMANEFKQNKQKTFFSDTPIYLILEKQ